MKNILIACPCYNEQETIIKFKKVCDTVIQNITNYNFEFLFVDDGSKDSTLSLINTLSHTDSKIHYLSFSRNFGKEAGMKAIFDYAKQYEFDALIIMDVDLQDDPKIIPNLIAKWECGYEHIYTKHKTRKGQSFFKKIFSKLFYKIFVKFTNFRDLKNGARDFALFDKKVIKAYSDYPSHERFMKGISSFVGFKKCCVEFDYQKRSAGKTKWSFKKLLKYAITGFNAFSTWLKAIPLLLAFVALAIFGLDFVYTGCTEGWLNTLQNTNIRLDLLLLAICLLTYVIVSLVYQVKLHAENKPLYIISKTDSNEVNKNDSEIK